MGLSTTTDILANYAKGINYRARVNTAAPLTSTSPVAASGYLIPKLIFSSGSTIPTALISFPLPTGITSNLRLTRFSMQNSGGTSFSAYLSYFYLVGTLNLAATGDQFTHNAATFPVLRTQFGVTSQPLSLYPMVYVTTATTTTAPIIRMRTAAGAAGYTDQDGNTVVGTRTITFPAAATTTDSCFQMRLEHGDSAVRDISAIEVTTAAAAGAASVFLVEPLTPLCIPSGLLYSLNNTMASTIGMPDLGPAVATSGTATTYLGILYYGSASGAIITADISAVYNP